VVSNDDVMKLVQEAVRQFGDDIRKSRRDVLPTIVLSNYWIEGRGPVFFIQRYKRNPFGWVGAAIAGEEVSGLKR
jgi:hypothetical protein